MDCITVALPFQKPGTTARKEQFIPKEWNAVSQTIPTIFKDLTIVGDTNNRIYPAVAKIEGCGNDVIAKDKWIYIPEDWWNLKPATEVHSLNLQPSAGDSDAREKAKNSTLAFRRTCTMAFIEVLHCIE